VVEALPAGSAPAPQRYSALGMDWPGQLETVPEVDIETRRSDDAPVHRTTIWAVVDGDDVFVRSLRGTAGRWYRELTANPAAVLRVTGEPVPVRAVAAKDSDSIERATAGYRRKYADSPYLDSMIRDEILDSTVRLAPER
jgi:hypothetical protein